MHIIKCAKQNKDLNKKKVKGMKKIILVLAVVFAGLTSVSANELAKAEVFTKLSNESTFRSLVRYLKVDAEQSQDLKYVFMLTNKRVNRALDKESVVDAEKAIMFNLGNAKHILSAEQYRKYLLVLNMTIQSKGDVYVANN